MRGPDRVWTEAWLRGLSRTELQKVYERVEYWRQSYGEPEGVQKRRFERVEKEWARRNDILRKIAAGRP